MEPSEYFHRQFYVTFEDDELGLRQRDVIGVENMLWGNDYRTATRSRPSRRRCSTGSSPACPTTRPARTCDNVVGLYGIRLDETVDA